MTASGKTDSDDKIKSAIFLDVAGSDAIDIFNTFTFADDADAEKLDILLEKFEAYCIPRKKHHLGETCLQHP